MGFVNQKLTEEQRREYELMQIAVPMNVGHIAKPMYRTIDCEADMCLIELGVYRDAPNERYFAFFWGQKMYTISLIMAFSADDGNVVKWQGIKDMSEYALSGNEPFIDDLKRALAVYYVWGKPDRESGTVICEFFGEIVEYHYTLDEAINGFDASEKISARLKSAKEDR